MPIVVNSLEPDSRERAPLTLAVAQPVCLPCAVASNAVSHAAVVRAASARVVVFPELSLTGYELDSAPVVATDAAELTPLIEACAQTGSVALVGAPVLDELARVCIATLAVTGEGAAVAYRKVWLGSEERDRFSAGSGAALYEVDGWRLGLAICKDTSVGAHTQALAQLEPARLCRRVGHAS